MLTAEQIEQASPEQARAMLREMPGLLANLIAKAAVMEPGAAGEGAPRWMSTAEATAYLNISRPTLLRYKAKGILHPVRMGRGDRFSSKELDLLPEMLGQGGPWK